MAMRPAISFHISIHAPARGATFASGYFIILVIFQSTLPRGERLHSVLLMVSLNYHFNPRSREGSDDNAICTSGISMISIHAPARGATVMGCCCTPITGFQSTLPRGERQIHLFLLLSVGISIHAPARGATAKTDKIFFII